MRHPTLAAIAVRRRRPAGRVGPAAAAEPYTRGEGTPRARAPRSYDKVFVQRFGSAKAKRVLVLVPGFLGGAGDFRADRPRHRQAGAATSRCGRSTAARRRSRTPPCSRPATRPTRARLLPGLQVQARCNASRRAVRGPLGPEAGARGPAPRRAQGARRAAGARSSSAATRSARPPRWPTPSWDFKRPARLPATWTGMVLIDGGLLGSFDAASLSEARSRAGKQIARGQGVRRPARASGSPRSPASWRSWPRCTPASSPTRPARSRRSPLIPPRVQAQRSRSTNEARAGLRVRQGHLAARRSA